MCGRYFVDDGMEREIKNVSDGLGIHLDWNERNLSDTDEMGISEKGPKGSAHQCKSGDGKGKAHV